MYTKAIISNNVVFLTIMLLFNAKATKFVFLLKRNEILANKVIADPRAWLTIAIVSA